MPRPWLLLLLLLLLVAVTACSQSERAPDPEERGSAPAGPEPSAASIELAPCERTDFCWVHGAPIHAIHGTLASGVFAVGAEGAILEWTGSGWRRHDGITREDVSDVFVAAKDDVWITAGQGEVFHYDGQSWRRSEQTGNTLAGSGPNDVWLGSQHFDGTSWRAEPHGLALNGDIVVLGPGDAWVVGPRKDDAGAVIPDGSVVLHHDGNGWQQVGGKLGEGYVGGTLLRSNGQLWAVAGARAYRYTGSGFEEVVGMNEAALWQIPEARAEYEGGVALYDGSNGFVTVPAAIGCLKAWRASPDDVWCFGGSGQLFHSAGEGWRAVPPDRFGETLGAGDFGRVPPALWAGGALLAWGDGPEHVLRVRETERSDPRIPAHVLERYEGGERDAWSELARGLFTDISGSRRDDVWIAGAGTSLWHYDGQVVTPVELPAELGELHPKAVHSLGPRATWLVAERYEDQRSLLLRYDGRWSIVREEQTGGLDGIALVDVAGSDERDLWLLATLHPNSKVPQGSILFHFDGESWQRHDLWRSIEVFTGLELDGDRVWLQSRWGAHELALADLPIDPAARIDLFPTIGRAVISAAPRSLWLGEHDVWLTNETQAMRRPR